LRDDGCAAKTTFCRRSAGKVCKKSISTVEWRVMAELRDHPYEGSSFLVSWGDSEQNGAFARIELPEAIIDEIAYRNGNEKTQNGAKQAGLTKFGPLTLKRGLHGSTTLWEWWRQTHEGVRDARTVTVSLLDETHSPVWTWIFFEAFPIGYRTTALDASSSEVVMEELTLTFESMAIQ
jgi:phage tail-like protein